MNRPTALIYPQDPKILQTLVNGGKFVDENAPATSYYLLCDIKDWLNRNQNIIFITDLYIAGTESNIRPALPQYFIISTYYLN